MAASATDFLQLMLDQRGKMYAWGAEGPDEFDCSGLPYWAAQQLGITIPRITYDMSSGLPAIARADLQPGDLILSDWGEGADSHVATYLGDGQLIEAPQQGQPVQVNMFDDNYASHATNFRRIPGINAGKGSLNLSGVASGVGAGVGAALAGTPIAGWINAPKTVTDAMTNVGNAAGNMAQSVAQIGRVGALIQKALLPSNILRGFMMGAGIVLILIGIWFLASEVRDA